MKILIYDRKQMNSYKDFYEQLYEDMDGKNMIDWEEFDYLGYNGNNLNEFLWYCHDRNIHYVFKNFDLEKIESYKNFEDYQWNIIFTIIKRLVQQYPNNKLEFTNEDL